MNSLARVVPCGALGTSALISLRLLLFPIRARSRQRLRLRKSAAREVEQDNRRHCRLCDRSEISAARRGAARESYIGGTRARRLREPLASGLQRYAQEALRIAQRERGAGAPIPLDGEALRARWRPGFRQ